MVEENKVLDEDMVISEEGKDELKEAIEGRFQKLRLQSMLLGGQAVCKTILDKITVFKLKPGKHSLNDYRRLIKDIEQFCEIGLSKEVVEDNNTNLTEEINESNINESNT